ncbi:MAG: acetolactate decarboxylase [Magnetococcales bacterium]|nr:acetolactate decarboxylase [Magnetococcales bacterium]
MKIIVKLCMIVLFQAFIVGCASMPANKQMTDNQSPDTLFQYATINALLAGLYDGDLKINALAEKGDFGLGTFNTLDGEMVVLDGIVYRVSIDGKARIVAVDDQTPFSTVAFFQPDSAFTLPAGLDYNALKKKLDDQANEPNRMVAFRVDGLFQAMKVRSVPAQSKPYRPLAQVVKDQAVFDYQNIRGTLVGFRLPAMMSGLNVPGYHFHFLDDTRQLGGHVLSLSTGTNNRTQVDVLHSFHLQTPVSSEFGHYVTGKNTKKDLHRVERDQQYSGQGH